MNAKFRKPSWWLPALFVFGMIGVLFLEALDKDLLPVEPGIELFTVVVAFGLLAFWVYTNQASLDNENAAHYKIVIVESQRTDSPDKQQFAPDADRIQPAPPKFSNS